MIGVLLLYLSLLLHSQPSSWLVMPIVQGIVSWSSGVIECPMVQLIEQHNCTCIQLYNRLLYYKSKIWGVIKGSNKHMQFLLTFSLHLYLYLSLISLNFSRRPSSLERTAKCFLSLLPRDLNPGSYLPHFTKNFVLVE